ncbi:MAG TPA: peptidylprolyl isomerase [Bacteroidetes bacterium]|nr:peptidylprolyl isomerase [Bacteroidota bacterium]
MKVEQKKVISVTYELRQNDSNGEILEIVTQENPMTVIFGIGNLLPDFEQNLNGLDVGESFNFTLTSEQAYGEYNNNAVISVPKETFVVDGELQEEMLYEGNRIPMMDEQGNKLTGVITSVQDDQVVMDFNHPLAGMSLFFKGEVVGVRDATPSELEHGHVHDHE